MLADDMKEYRKNNLISQTELAKRCGTSQMMISVLENGKKPSFLTEAKIRKVIGGYADAEKN